MMRDPAEFEWHCWSNTAHPPPSSTTFLALTKKRNCKTNLKTNRKFSCIALTALKLDIFHPLQRVDVGAQTTIHVAVSEDVDRISGKYFVDCKVRCLSEYLNQYERC